jgi:tRNA 2-thiouridine synthesizing protein C
MESTAKKVMFLMRKAPHGSIYSLAGLEAMLIMGAYEQDVSVVFVDDGVYAIKKDQETSEAGVREFSRTFRALQDHDVEKIYIDGQSMQSRGLSLDDLIIKPEVLEESAIAKLMEEQDVILPF